MLWLVAIPMVRPTLSSNMQLLEWEFANRYHNGSAVFYILTTNEVGKSAQFFNGGDGMRGLHCGRRRMLPSRKT